MNNKVFVVISDSGSFDNYISQIEGIFSTEEKAKKFAKEFMMTFKDLLETAKPLL